MKKETTYTLSEVEALIIRKIMSQINNRDFTEKFTIGFHGIEIIQEFLDIVTIKEDEDETR